MRFEQEGLFIGLISYPFSTDGKELYEHIFQPFFSSHREDYLCKHCYGPIEENLYKPVAYRMFGNYGITILSLIDEYAFGCRIFNPGHISSDNNEKQYKYKSVVVIGSSETSDENAYLLPRADKTFLAKKKRYPFIGVIRLKLDYRVLIGRGLDAIEKIKAKIESLKTNLVECLVVDTYDNDELVTIAFSNDLDNLYPYLDGIRKLTCRDVGIDCPQGCDNVSKHVFASCHISFGYDIGFSFGNVGNENFQQAKFSSTITINCLLETKPGHRDVLCNILSEKLKDFVDNSEPWLRRTITGGSIVHAQIPITAVESLQKIAYADTDFISHVRRIKLTLNDDRQVSTSSQIGNHFKSSNVCKLFPENDISEVKTVLKQLGVSKIVRDRLLALLDLFNDCGANKLQSYYFEQLKNSVCNLKKVLYDALNGDSDLWMIEASLNEEINAFETAFYNRIHNNMTPNTILEYSGGIQQHLQAFGFAYKKIVEILDRNNSNVQYTCITGEEKVSSVRTHIELNINHIIYPQLFATTVWKEAANFSNIVLDRLNERPGLSEDGLEIIRQINTYRSFIRDSSSFDVIKNSLYQETDLNKNDIVYAVIDSLIDKELVKYTISDYIVYHFAFQRNFQMMWHFYMKVLLQTSSAYHRLGKIKRRAFVFVLMRLMLVALRDAGRNTGLHHFIEEQTYKPFDSVLAPAWMECYNKTLIACKNIFKTLENYSYSDVSNDIILFSEYGLVESEPYIKEICKKLYNDNIGTINAIIEAREKRIHKLEEKFNKFELAISGNTENYKSPDNIVCLLSAYLKIIYNIDSVKKQNLKLCSMPRNFDGEVSFPKIDEIDSFTSDILPDTIGGFFVPNPEVRKKYFGYRTTLFRTLWHLSYKSDVQI